MVTALPKPITEIIIEKHKKKSSIIRNTKEERKEKFGYDKLFS